MKKLLPILLLLPVAIVHAQKHKREEIRFVVYDENWKACKIEDAKYLSALEKLSDTAYELKVYNFKGPIISVETYKDAEATILNGEMIFYGPDGAIDSSGSTINGRKHDWWYYYTDSSTLWMKEEYNNGKLLNRMDTAAIREENEKNKDEWSTSIKKDEIEASFEGGDKGWVKYVQKNIDFPTRAKSLNIGGNLMIQFIIDKEGNVTQAKINRSVEYSIDQEGLRLIKSSPKWKPAWQNGQYVKAYRKQPLNFSVPQ
jgi:periplasmic protein TonB